MPHQAEKNASSTKKRRFILMIRRLGVFKRVESLMG
jgi:hypothetical protein